MRTVDGKQGRLCVNAGSNESNSYMIKQLLTDCYMRTSQDREVAFVLVSVLVSDRCPLR